MRASGRGGRRPASREPGNESTGAMAPVVGAWSERGTTLPGNRWAPDDPAGGPRPARRPLRGRGGRGRRGALELMTSLGDFDVAIVELAARRRRPRDGLTGMPAIRALRKARPGLGIVAHGAAARAPRGRRRRSTPARRPTSPRARPPSRSTQAVDAAADAESFVDPAATKVNGAAGLTRRQREILQLFADGLSTDDVAKRLGLSTETVPHPHQGRPRPPRGPRPRPRGRDRPPPALID